jgi:hypothetical protein
VSKYISHFTKIKQTNNDFYFEDDFIFLCLDYLEKVYLEKKINSILNVHNYAIDIFQIQKPKIEKHIPSHKKIKSKKQAKKIITENNLQQKLFD